MIFGAGQDNLMTTYVKVKMKGKKAVYLKDPKVVKGFLVGYQYTKNMEPVLAKTPEGLADVKHMIQIGSGVMVVPQVVNNTYCELEDAK